VLNTSFFNGVPPAKRCLLEEPLKEQMVAAQEEKEEKKSLWSKIFSKGVRTNDK